MKLCKFCPADLAMAKISLAMARFRVLLNLPWREFHSPWRKFVSGPVILAMASQKFAWRAIQSTNLRHGEKYACHGEP
jgi:hypothetical protein